MRRARFRAETMTTALSAAKREKRHIASDNQCNLQEKCSENIVGLNELHGATDKSTQTALACDRPQFINAR